jgi:hypothetical protein
VPYCTRLIIFHFSSHCSSFDFNVKSEDLDIILNLHARPDLCSFHRTSFGGGPRISISKFGSVLTSTHSESDLQLDQPPSPSRSLPCQFSPTQYLNSRPGIDSDSITASTITESALPPVRAIRRHHPIVFASLTLSLATRLSSHRHFVQDKKGCETPTTTADYQFASPVLHTLTSLRRVGFSDTYPSKVRRSEEDSPLRHFGSNRSASEVRWLTERFPTTR